VAAGGIRESHLDARAWTTEGRAVKQVTGNAYSCPKVDDTRPAGGSCTSRALFGCEPGTARFNFAGESALSTKCPKSAYRPLERGCELRRGSPGVGPAWSKQRSEGVLRAARRFGGGGVPEEERLSEGTGWSVTACRSHVTSGQAPCRAAGVGQPADGTADMCAAPTLDPRTAPYTKKKKIRDSQRPSCSDGYRP